MTHSVKDAEEKKPSVKNLPPKWRKPVGFIVMASAGQPRAPGGRAAELPRRLANPALSELPKVAKRRPIQTFPIPLSEPRL